MALGAGAAFPFSYLSEPTYQASTTLLINEAPASSSSPDYTSLLTSERLAKTYAELLHKRPVLEAVIASLKLGATPEALGNHLKTSAVRDTQLIVLTVEDTDSQRAAAIANEIVRVFSQQNHDLQAGRYADTKSSLQQELARVQSD
jgi:non-specific protein-tyrosine kinase